jgi:hypothetical protein
LLHFITDTTHYADSILGANAEGTVHSVYRKTINLLLGGQLLAIQAAGSPLSPLSLLASLSEEQLGALPISAGQRVVCGVSDQILCIHAAAPVCFSWKNAARHSTVPQAVPSRETLSLLARTIRTVLTQSDRNGFSLIVQNDPAAEDSLIFSAAKRFLLQAQQAFRAGQYADSAEALGQVVGLGIGLTPSGDDFLCGVLAGLHLLGCTEEPFGRQLRQTVTQQLSRTNDISAAFLTCACRGQFSQAVCRLSDGLTPTEMAHLFSAIGHSSGMDTLCGVLFCLQLDLIEHE